MLVCGRNADPGTWLFTLRDDGLVDTKWDALPFAKGECYVCWFSFIDLHSPFMEPMFSASDIMLKIERGCHGIGVSRNNCCIIRESNYDCFPACWEVRCVKRIQKWAKNAALGNTWMYWVSIWSCIIKFGYKRSTLEIWFQEKEVTWG
jgi:hypothetical protein